MDPPDLCELFCCCGPWRARRLWRAEAEKKVAENKALELRLELEGHRCVEIAMSYPGIVHWCGKTPCAEIPDAADDFDRDLHPPNATKSERAMHRRKTELLAQVRARGHTCMRIFSNQHPMHFDWCHEEPCLGKLVWTGWS